ncbi:MAG: HEAT repeat domain-containing protein [Blastocatellales bacterium]
MIQTVHIAMAICFVCLCINSTALAQSIPTSVHARIIQLEDERNLNGDELPRLLKHSSPKVRERAALAIGRIGDKRGTDALIELFNQRPDANVRAMAAFALGEMEDVKAVSALSSAISSMLMPPHKRDEPAVVRARVCEALGKIFSANKDPKPQTDDLGILRPASEIARQLPPSQAKLSADEKLLAGLAITALMRMQVGVSVEPLTEQLKSSDADIRAQAANALARIRQPIESAVPALLEALNDSDHNVRANAARALGVSKDARAVEPLIKLLNDKSEQVQVNAIRALAAIGDKRAVEPIIVTGKKTDSARMSGYDDENILLEVITALHLLKDDRALPFLRQLRLQGPYGVIPELEVAVARYGEREFLYPSTDRLVPDSNDPKWAANLAQGLGELRTEQSKEFLLWLLGRWDGLSLQEKKDDYREAVSVIPFILRALAKQKPATLPFVLRTYLLHEDEIVRATAANLIADTTDDLNFTALVGGWLRSEHDKSNDAKLGILSALAKYKTPKAIDAVKNGLNDGDHLVRRHAANLLQQLGAGDFSDRIGTVQTGHDKLFYQRVVARTNKKVTATIHTDNGAITMELFPQDAPITVDSFITLARKGFFNDLTFHRVVPNFVIQGGDPRGDGEGGPGYQIRCEVNTRPYLRGTVGMALSGKDTGGSQFFITHSPQPHLDGGYTVFGQVTNGMDVVDRIARGDSIRNITIIEK